MVNAFDVPKSGQPLTALGPVVQALARAGNGLRSLTFKQGDEWDWSWDDGNAVITGPVFTLKLVQIDFCENNVPGTRYVLCTDFVPNS